MKAIPVKFYYHQQRCVLISHIPPESVTGCIAVIRNRRINGFTLVHIPTGRSILNFFLYTSGDILEKAATAFDQLLAGVEIGDGYAPSELNEAAMQIMQQFWDDAFPVEAVAEEA